MKPNAIIENESIMPLKSLEKLHASFDATLNYKTNLKFQVALKITHICLLSSKYLITITIKMKIRKIRLNNDV